MKQLLLLFTLFALSLSINAQTNTWLGGDGYWDDVAMWSTGAIPTSSETVVINNGTVKALSGYIARAKKVEIHSNGYLSITSGGYLFVEGSSTSVHGITVSGDLNVTGRLYVRNINNGEGIQVSGDGRFKINKNGIVSIRDIDGMGIWNSSEITNKGKLFIRNTTSNGMLNYGTIDNDGGKFSLLNINGTGVYCYLNGHLINSGEIHVKGADSAISIYADSDVINEEEGKIYASYITSSAISTSNNPNSIFENYGLINATWSIDYYGLANEGQFINYETGEVVFDQADYGIVNFINSSLTNEGTITVEDQMTSGALYNNGGTLDNSSCGEIFLNHRMINTSSGIINNEGWIYNTDTNVSSNFGVFDNKGVIEDNPNTLTPILTNDGIIALPLSGNIQVGVPVTNALTLGLLDSFTVEGWYTDISLNTSAGTYDPLANEWLPDATALGITEVFVKLTHNTESCSNVISIDITNGVQPFSVPDIFGIQAGGIRPASAEFMTFPNPSNGQFSIKTPEGLHGACTLQIFHSTGQILWEQTTELNQVNTLNLQSVQGLPNGIYQLVVLQKGELLWQDQISIIKN